MAGRYGQRVKFYNVEQICVARIEEFKRLLSFARDPKRTVGMFFRFLIGELLPDVKKCIYLDADIIVNLDVNELWKTELGDKPLGVVTEVQSYVPTNPLHYLCREGFVKPEDFFNSGVLIMNLERLRREEETLKRGIKFRVEHPECDGNDQSILNYCFSTQTVKLPLKFNVLVEYARIKGDFATTDRICHYITSSYGKGYGLDADDAYNRLWMSYFVKTPWFDEATLGKLYAGFKQVHVGLKNTLINLSALLSGKSRAFFAAPNSVDGLKKLFAIRPDEKIIPAENKESLNKLLDAMKRSRGKRVFFIMLPGFPYQMLIQAGFVAGKDFVNGLDFLSEEHGFPFNSYLLIQAM